MTDKTFHNYHDFLKDEIMSYRGDLEEYIFLLPELFKILTALLDAPELNPRDRNRIFCALGYFVAPNDLVPEEIYGPAGYVDDVYLCAYIVREIMDRYGIDLVRNFWHDEEDDLEETISYCLEATARELGDTAPEVLKYTGLEE